MLREHVPGLEWKEDVLKVLSGVLGENCHELRSSGELLETGQRLLLEQKELASLSLSPHQEQQWVKNKIVPKWKTLLGETCFWDPSEINSMLDRLSKSLRTGMDYDFSTKIDGLPLELLRRWSKLAYTEITSGNLSQLDEIIRLVEHPALPIRHREQMLKVLKSLKALVYTIPEVEEKTTRILHKLRHGTWTEDTYRFDLDLPNLESDVEFGMSLAN